MDFVLTSALLSIGKLCVALGFLAGFAWLLERALGFDMKGAVDALEKTAKDGNALPLAVVLAALIVAFAGILERFQ